MTVLTLSARAAALGLLAAGAFKSVGIELVPVDEREPDLEAMKAADTAPQAKEYRPHIGKKQIAKALKRAATIAAKRPAGEVT